MGNMSNPSVNRFGLNTFWYKFWYSDNRYSATLSQDFIFEKLINIYLFYGLNNFKNIFYNSYWFYSSNKNISLTKYFRWVPAKQTEFGLNPEYRLRFTVTDIYPMKLWILRYGRWFIFNMYWFQPLKIKKFRSKRRRRSRLDQYRVTGGGLSTNLQRLKALVSYQLIRHLRSRVYYEF